MHARCDCSNLFKPQGVSIYLWESVLSLWSDWFLAGEPLKKIIYILTVAGFVYELELGQLKKTQCFTSNYAFQCNKYNHSQINYNTV